MDGWTEDRKIKVRVFPGPASYIQLPLTALKVFQVRYMLPRIQIYHPAHLDLVQYAAQPLSRGIQDPEPARSGQKSRSYNGYNDSHHARPQKSRYHRFLVSSLPARSTIN